MWYDPEGRVPESYTPVTYEEFGAELQTQLVSSQGLFYVLVNSSIYSGIESNLTQYVTDLQNEGYSVNTYTISGGTPQEIRSFIGSALPNGLVGVLFVGDIPEAWFEMDSDWGHEEFPIDLFYMDLDGNWTDSDEDNIYDGHDHGDGDKKPEIYVGRLKASNIDGDEVSMINGYFEKIHNYRIGGFSLPKRALVYIDDDWVWWAKEDNKALKLVYDETTLVKDEATTNATDYKKRITEGTGYEWVHLRCHGSYRLHRFKIPDGWDGTVNSSDYRSMNPKAIFYQLFVCSAARYTSPNNLAGTIVLATSHGVLVVSSTKTGGMLYFSDFYGPVAQEKSMGVAFQEWFIDHGESDPKWFYGLTIIGDPTLQVRRPVHNIDTGLNYLTIQSAIDDRETANGHTIQVDAGTCWEHVVLDKSLTLVGEDPSTTIIDGSGTGNVVAVRANNVNISRFTIQNGDYGVDVLGSKNNNITENRVVNNYYGIHLERSSDNVIHHNNFINNTNQAYCCSQSSNTWDDGYPSGGNYWSDYTGEDLYSGPYQNETGSDGIGDTPYVIDQNNQDNYPLMNPYILGDQTETATWMHMTSLSSPETTENMTANTN